MLDEIEYLGFVISAAGILSMKQKLEAIQQAAAPENVGELQSFIGLANFLRRFVPDFAEIMSPLYKPLKKIEAKWKWGKLKGDLFKKNIGCFVF